MNTTTGPVPLAGYGALAPEVLADLGFDPASSAGFAVDFGLDRLAMIRLGIRDVRQLWRPPYVR